MHGLPLVFSYDFTTTGTYNLFTSVPELIPLLRSLNKWAIQVTGLDANGAIAAPTSWDVMLLGSLDNIAYNETSLIAEHVNTSSSNGDVVWQTTSSKSFYLCRFCLIKVKALVLGATATKIRVTIMGCV